MDGQSVQNLPTGVRFVQCVEMNSRNTFRPEVFALSDRMFDADLQLRRFVVLDSGQSAGEIVRKRTSTHGRDPLNPGVVSDRHDARHNGFLDAQCLAAVAKRKKTVVGKEQLGDHRVGAGIHLAFQVLQIGFQGFGFLVLFRIAGNTDSEVRVVFSNEFHQFVRILQTTVNSLKRIFPLRCVAAQCHDISDARLFGCCQQLHQFVASRSHAGQVSHRRSLQVLLNVAAPLQRTIARGTASTVRAGHESRLVGNQLLQMTFERLVSLFGFWREDLNGNSEIVAGENVGQLHEQSISSWKMSDLRASERRMCRILEARRGIDKPGKIRWNESVRIVDSIGCHMAGPGPWILPAKRLMLSRLMEFSRQKGCSVLPLNTRCWTVFIKDGFMRCLGLAATLLLCLVGCAEQPSPSPSSSSSDGDTERLPVRLALNWYPEAEHGGYFAAEEQGSYESQGLQVELIPGSPGASRLILQELATGRVEFAVSNADQVVEQRARGLPIVALLAPVQQSPRCIMVHESSGIDSLDQLADVELAISETRPFALWMKKKLPMTNVTLVPFNGLVGEFLAKPNFAQQAYVFSEPFIATEQGGDPVSLMLSDIGYNPYSSVLVTSEDLLQQQPELVNKMVTACRSGWAGYLEMPELTNRRIHEVNSEMTLAALDYGATALQSLCRTGDGVPVGGMTSERWQQLIDQLEELEVIDPGSVSAEDCYHRFDEGQSSDTP